MILRYPQHVGLAGKEPLLFCLFIHITVFVFEAMFTYTSVNVITMSYIMQTLYNITVVCSVPGPLHISSANKVTPYTEMQIHFCNFPMNVFSEMLQYTILLLLRSVPGPLFM